MTRIEPLASSISTESRMRVRSSMSLCLNLIVRPNARRQPSMIDAWFIRSQRMTSSLPTSTEIVPRFVWKPGGEEERLLLADELREPVLQLLVDVEGPVEEPRAGAAAAVLLDRP
jgi:hypothetical protein